MTTAETTYSAEFHSGYRATLTVSVKGVRCEWSPDLPRTLEPSDRDALLKAYRGWRDECLEDFARLNRLVMRSVRTDGIDAIVFSRTDDAT